MRVLYENSLLQLLAKQHRLDVMHRFANTSALVASTKTVVTVHDLQVFDNPESFSLVWRLYMKTMIARTARRADMLAPVSNKTASDIKRLFRVEDRRISVLPNPLSSVFKRANNRETESFKSCYNLPSEFWLYVSHYYPHKNHRRLFEAYSKLRAQRQSVWPLVLRGEKNGADAEIDHIISEYGISGSVIWLPRLSAEELPVLYSCATCLVFPSLYEGAGIPVMEAMACECPVAASDIAAIREFAGDAAVLFDPTDAQSIADAMARVASDAGLRGDCALRGKERARELSAELVVDKLCKVYDEVVRRAG